MMIRSLVILVAIASAAVVVPAAAEDNAPAAGRYQLAPGEGSGFVRLDTRTGTVSHCRQQAGVWRCDPIVEFGADGQARHPLGQGRPSVRRPRPFDRPRRSTGRQRRRAGAPGRRRNRRRGDRPAAGICPHRDPSSARDDPLAQARPCRHDDLRLLPQPAVVATGRRRKNHAVAVIIAAPAPNIGRGWMHRLRRSGCRRSNRKGR